MGKNDSFIYSMHYQYKNGNQNIKKKKQITAREYIEFMDLKAPMSKQVRKMR